MREVGNETAVSTQDSQTLLSLTEDNFVGQATAFLPADKEGVFAKFQYKPPKLAPDASQQECEACKREYDAEYKSRCFQEFVKFANEEESDVYLALQPVWRVNEREKQYTLAQVEVLVRAKNGRDAAPMPAFAMFQHECKEDALLFLRTQLLWAGACARKLQHIMVSVNVRPDELLASASFIQTLNADLQSEGCRNLIIEVTEYSPITPDVLRAIQELKEGGVMFALDDVNNVKQGERGYAAPGHACTFEVASEHAQLFNQQKLAIHLACQVFNVQVHTTPGEVDKYFASLLLNEHVDVDAVMIAERRDLVEKWVGDVRLKNPNTTFVIEASVHPEDVCIDDGSINMRFPQIDLFGGSFMVQGGKTGGRCFSIDTFLSFGLEGEGYKFHHSDVASNSNHAPIVVPAQGTT